MVTEIVNCFLNIVFSGHLAAIHECFRIYGAIPADAAINDIRNFNLKFGPSNDFKVFFEREWVINWE